MRMSFSKIDEALKMPNPLSRFRKNRSAGFGRGADGSSSRHIPDNRFSGNLLIEFVSYSIDTKPKYSVDECKEHDANYAAPLKVNVRLTNKQTGEVKQSEIYGRFSARDSDKGTFIINGAERVIVSQIVRSPGIYYDSTIDKTGKRLFSAQVIPYRGVWLEYETDVNDVLYVRVDKNRKLPITSTYTRSGHRNGAGYPRVFSVRSLS